MRQLVIDRHVTDTFMFGAKVKEERRQCFGMLTAQLAEWMCRGNSKAVRVARKYQVQWALFKGRVWLPALEEGSGGASYVFRQNKDRTFLLQSIMNIGELRKTSLNFGSHFPILLRDYFISFKLFNMSWPWLNYPGAEVHWGRERKIHRRVLPVSTKPESGHFTSLLWRER